LTQIQVKIFKKEFEMSIFEKLFILIGIALLIWGTITLLRRRRPNNKVLYPKVGEPFWLGRYPGYFSKERSEEKTKEHGGDVLAFYSPSSPNSGDDGFVYYVEHDDDDVRNTLNGLYGIKEMMGEPDPM